MAYIMPTGSCVEVVVRYGVSNQQYMNVLHYLTSGANSTDGAASITGLLAVINSNSGVLGKMSQCQAVNCIYGYLTGQMISAVRYVPVYAGQYTLHGQLSGTCNFPQSSVTYTKRSQVASRHSLGSFHLGGIPDDMAAAGSVNDTTYSTTLNNLGTAVSAAVTVSGGLTFTPVILNRNAIGSSAVIASTAYQSTIRTMRRRVLGRGI